MFSVAPILAVRNSVLIALGTTVLSLAFGLPAAYAVHDQRSRSGRRVTTLETIFMLPLGTSAVTLGLGYILAFATPPIDWRASPVMMPIAHTLVALPFVVRAVLPALRSIDPVLREAARVMGATPGAVWREIDLPILLRAMLVAATLAFATSLGEFGASLIISRPEFPTMPVVIFAFLGQPGARNFNTALAMSTVLMVVSGLSYALIERVRLGDSEF